MAGDCEDIAQAEHTNGIIQCTSASLAFAFLTGPGALVIQVVCLAGNMNLYLEKLEACKH